MERHHVIEILKSFISREILEGQDIGLDEHTPLLQYGIINSITLFALLSYIEAELSIRVPADELRPHNLRTLAVMADMLIRLHAAHD